MRFFLLNTVMIVVGVLSLLGGCSSPSNNQEPTTAPRPLAKFEPEEGKVLLFAGQELESVGGLEAPYNDGYLDHFDRPAGWTAYSNLSPGDTSFGYVQKGLDGIYSSDDWGDSPSNLSMQMADPDFEHMAVAIGLSLVNHEEAVANGERDSLITAMGELFLSMNGRPVFLRIGYEFDGHSWNHYDRASYITAYKRIKDMLDDMGVENVAYVWQSTGWVSNQDHLEAWYPGDEYVDWCAYSFFARWSEAEMIEFARAKRKPVFIAEATPTISDFTIKFDGQTKETILSNEVQAKEAWEKWFVPFFNTIEENEDVVKAISYINCNWKSHPMWVYNPTFQKIDARLQSGEWIKAQWLKEINKPRYLKASPGLYTSDNATE
ncbi:MAG: glycosyl hydrolase [Bacteroidota bacterium]